MFSEESRIAPLIRSAFRRYGYPQLERVECRGEGSTVILSGTLPTFHLKKVAQTIAQSVPQVACVENHIEVVAMEESDTATSPTRQPEGDERSA